MTLGSTWKERAGWMIVLIAIIALIKWDSGRWDTKVSHPTPTTTVVEAPTVTEKLVTRYVTDPAAQHQADELLKENSRLKQQVISLTSTLATLKTSGGVGVNGGIITLLPRTTLTTTTEVTPEPAEFQFSDYQLTAKYSSKPTFTYDLHQDFIITSSTAIGKDGQRTATVTLGQKTPSGLLQVPTETVAFFSDPRTPHWLLSPRIQGGFGATQDGKVGIAAIQWLKFGKGSAAEDVKFAVLSPAVSTSGLTLLPFSWNTGSVKHNPFTNVWLSPSIDLNKRVGFVVSATF